MISKTAYYNTGHCPNQANPKSRERGNFVTDEKGLSRYVVEKSWVEFASCMETRYEEIEGYRIPEGIDPGAKRVKCVSCGQRYWLFPRKGLNQTTEE